MTFYAIGLYEKTKDLLKLCSHTPKKSKTQNLETVVKLIYIELEINIHTKSV